MIYDTKAISETLGLFNNTQLHPMSTLMTSQKRFKNYLEFEFDVSHGFSKYLNKQMLHEAGYDSYLTGIVFASVCKYLEADQFLAASKNASKENTLKERPFKMGDDPTLIMQQLNSIQMSENGSKAMFGHN